MTVDVVGQLDSCMPPPLLAAMVHSPTSSSRTSSPERPLPHLTAAVIPQHQPDVVGFPEHQPDIVADVLGWKLVPDEFLRQQPPPPSVIYGAHHLLRLFGKFSGCLCDFKLEQTEEIMTQSK